MKAVIFERARINAIEHKIANGNVSSRIKCSAQFTTKNATSMEARWVMFDRDELAKSGYKAIELDYEMKNLRLRFAVPEMKEHELDLTCELAAAFKVFRQGDGKKKPKKLMVQFKLETNGSPFELLEYMIKIGGAEGKLELEPLQKELFDQEQAVSKSKTASSAVQ